MALDNNPFQTVLQDLLDDMFTKKGVNSPFSTEQDTAPPAPTQLVGLPDTELSTEQQGNAPQGKNLLQRESDDGRIQRVLQKIFGLEDKRIDRQRNQFETAPVFVPVPAKRPVGPPAISDPRFRPNTPVDPLAQPGVQVQNAQPDTRLAQAGPEIMTDAPKDKPLIAPVDLINAVITQESGGDPNAVSPRGAIGLMQIMPATATDPGFGVAPIPVEKLTNAAANRKFGTEYLSAMLNRYHGDTRRALIAFNAGHTVADRFKGNLSSLPAETQNYVARIEATLGKRGAEAQSAPETPAGAPTALEGAPGTPTSEIGPQDPAVGPEATPVLPQPGEVSPLPPPPEFHLEVPTLAEQGGTRRPVVPLLWQQAMAKFQQSRDPKDLVDVPKHGLPAILALMGQVARRSRS